MVATSIFNGCKNQAAKSKKKTNKQNKKINPAKTINQKMNQSLKYWKVLKD